MKLLSQFGFTLVLAVFGKVAMADSITFSPANPTASESITATLTMPFDCAAPSADAVLTASTNNSLTFATTVPSGIVNCPFVPFPPPQTMSIAASIGSLSAGTYTITWNTFWEDSSGQTTLWSSTSAQLVVVGGPAVAHAAVDGYMSGNWYSAIYSGQGFQLEMTPDGTMVAIWFAPSLDGSGQSWIYAQGSYDNTRSSVTLPAVLVTGGAFPHATWAHDVTKTPWGSISFVFTDCDNGTASWVSSLPGYGSGSLPISRLTRIGGTTCP